MMMFALLALGAAMQVSPVQKVVQLLGELKTKVEADIANEGKLMEEYSAWCDEEANDKEDSIRSSKRTIADASATIQDASATVDSLTRKISDYTTQISSSERELHTATDLRSKAQEDFAASEKELLSTVDTLERSEAVLKRNLGLVQGGKVVGELSKLASGLQSIVNAGNVNSHEKAVLQSLLQASSSQSDEDLSFQPQATTSAIESQSDGIVDTIADMRDKAEGSLSSLRKDEMEAGHATAMLKQGLEDEVAVLKRQLSDASAIKSQTEEELHAAEEELASTQKALGNDKDYLSELKTSCQAKAAEWAERKQSAGDETAAITKASEVLSSGVEEFLQTSTHSRRVSAVDESRTNVVSMLRTMGKQFRSSELMQLASRASSDPFGKVRGLIEGMITKLMKAAAAEADQKAFCDEEKEKSTSTKNGLSQKLDKVSVRMEKAESGKAKLQEMVLGLEGEVAEIDAGTAEALNVRTEEHADYVKVSAEYKDSAKAIARAITVLDQYYSAGAFVQVAARDASPQLGGNKGDVASTIVGLLEVAESDFTRLLSEAEAEEDSSASAYSGLVQESKVTKVSKQGDIKGKTSQISQIETALLNYKEDHSTLSQELDAVLMYLDKLKPQCETKVMSYAEKKGKREQEIEGLREALSSLSPEAAMLQKSLRGA